ncbi:MAG: hypothetical protein QGH76_02750 [Phycisphaerales bacterium]|nr:hypothetical protein [Phycisphaerales bacterium]
MPPVGMIVVLCVASGGPNPWADVVLGYESGKDAAPGYTDADAALGEPARFTGEGVWPSVVSAFNPPFMPHELVSIAAGGWLVVSFDEPVEDDPANLYGIDLIVFGNTACIDGAYPSGTVDGVFGEGNGLIEVSPDGDEWFAVGSGADGLWPTIGYLDSSPYDAIPGVDMTMFTRPVDPRLALADMLGQTHDAILDVYRGSGGGVGVDIASSGLASVSFIRLSGNGDASFSVEIDAVVDAEPRLAGDVDVDGDVDVEDLLAVIAGFGPLPVGAPPADFNGDWAVDVIDLLIVIANWS